MNRNQRMLVALSGTDTDRPLIEYARLLANLGFGRHFFFVHVLKQDQLVEDPTADARWLRHFGEQVAEVFDKPLPNVTTSCHVQSGVRIDQLIDFTTQHRCDLILLGHRRSRSGQRSLARRLAMIAPCSVLLVPEGAPVSISTILAPIDFSNHSGDSLEVAASIARAAGLGRCLATHVYFDESTIRYDEHVKEIRRNEQAAFETFLSRINTHNMTIEPIFAEGNNIAGTILYTAEQRGADLLVMNTRGRSPAAAILLGSVVTQGIVETKVAILVVKHFGAMMNLFQALQQSQFWARHNPKTN